MPSQIDISTISKLDRFAKKITSGLQGGDVLALVGPFGAGKTTFVQHLAKHLGVAERITSPTFTLMHLHPAVSEQRGKRLPVSMLVHIDAYRLSGSAELAAIGATDYIGAPETVAVIEWADKVKKLLPKKTKQLVFSVAGKKRVVDVA